MGSQSLPVCKVFFLNTLSISDKTVHTALRKKSGTGIIEPEKRGKDETMRIKMTAYINRFPSAESHYCREKSSKDFLREDVDISKMYNILEKGFELYRQVFRSLNLSFIRPKKDQCNLCMSYREGSVVAKQIL
ncbi:hypothetical protein PR048_004242 [Dryococelus australis]|uniref:Uncharacterized protein n=1 Tax=Dryococelus australis TaxID=614101 RepID=A0ABQ9I6V6_9NEOP|nr:hypothetical protein PR048_004242 [Dryococelus australis]